MLCLPYVSGISDSIRNVIFLIDVSSFVTQQQQQQQQQRDMSGSVGSDKNSSASKQGRERVKRQPCVKCGELGKCLSLYLIKQVISFKNMGLMREESYAYKVLANFSKKMVKQAIFGKITFWGH